MILRQRAWCMQEELLSLRFVHFTQYEIVFTCKEGTICECDPTWFISFSKSITTGHEDHNISRDADLRLWCNILEQYIRRRITFHQDRLPAISSLTSLFEEGSGDYFAGLWYSHLPESLLWMTGSGRRPRPLDETTSAPPSWSWASIEGGIFFTYAYSNTATIPVKSEAEVLDIAVQPSTKDPRGLVTGGHITIRGRLLPLEFAWNRYAREDQTQHSINLDPSHHIACTLANKVNEDLEWDSGTCACSLDNIAALRPLPNSGVFDTAVYLLVLAKKSYEALRSRPHGFYGLLLQPLESLGTTQKEVMKSSNSERAFVRFGVGSMWLSERSMAELRVQHRTTVTIF